MIDINKYEDAKKMIEDAGLIDDNDGWLDVHYRKIAHLLVEVKRLQKKNVEIRNEIHVALDNERMRNGANEGWLKALEYVLALMDVQEEEE